MMVYEGLGPAVWIHFRFLGVSHDASKIRANPWLATLSPWKLGPQKSATVRIVISHRTPL